MLEGNSFKQEEESIIKSVRNLKVVQYFPMAVPSIYFFLLPSNKCLGTGMLDAVLVLICWTTLSFCKRDL